MIQEEKKGERGKGDEDTDLVLKKEFESLMTLKKI